jgi:hypothetical protein
VNFLTRYQNTNVVVISVPHRFHLKENSVNAEIKRYNRKLSKVVNKFDNVLLINVTSGRFSFTKHGFHMNVIGKELMVRKLTQTLPLIFDRHHGSVLILLTWMNDSNKQIDIIVDHNLPQDEITDDNPHNNCGKANGNFISDLNSGHKVNLCRVSRRLRKCPKSKNEDFLLN